MLALLFACPDHLFKHFVLLRTEWRDELLFQSVALNETRVIAAGKDKAIKGSQQEKVLDFSE